MIEILNANGKVVQRSQNLRGMREYAGKHGVGKVSISAIPNGGLLSVFFQDGAACTTTFADFRVLQQFVRNWRNAHGADLSVNGIPRFTVGRHNPVGF